MPATEKNKPTRQTEKPPSGAGFTQQRQAQVTENGKHVEVCAEVEIGGSKGLEPTRYGDWEHNGRCTDF